MNLGKLGVWAFIDELSAADTAALAQRIERWGYGTLWIPETFGRDPFVSAAWLLANTRTLNVATGIANIYARDAVATVAAQHALAEQSGGRFLLGVGVSHRPFVESMRGHQYDKPVATMKAYLQAMRATKYMAPPPAEKPNVVLAALGPKMLALAASDADGAHPYYVTPEFTASARAILGRGKLLCVEQKVILETDPAVARGIARRMLAHSLPLPNYRNNFLRMGFGERDFEQGGSDRLVDALIAWGDATAIRRRIQQHWDAGADHVCVQSLPAEGASPKRKDERIFALLAPSR